jgi:hypothetical protein
VLAGVNFIVSGTALLADFTHSDSIELGRFCRRGTPQSRRGRDAEPAERQQALGF